MRDHHLHLERVLREQGAIHFRLCTRAQRFHPERDRCRVARRTRVTSWLQADSRIISMRVHRTALRHPVVSTPNVESVEIDDGRIGELPKVQPDWPEGLRDLAQSRVSYFYEALDEVRSLLQRRR